MLDVKVGRHQVLDLEGARRVNVRLAECMGPGDVALVGERVVTIVEVGSRRALAELLLAGLEREPGRG